MVRSAFGATRLWWFRACSPCSFLQGFSADRTPGTPEFKMREAHDRLNEIERNMEGV